MQDNEEPNVCETETKCELQEPFQLLKLESKQVQTDRDPEVERELVALERERLSIERERLVLERERLALQRVERERNDALERLKQLERQCELLRQNFNQLDKLLDANAHNELE
jgi:hypothetical protein